MLIAEATAASRYTSLETNRQPYLDRGRDCAKVTIPSLMVPSGYSSATKLNTTWQSVGASCINTLAQKLLLALLPPNEPFFRLRIEQSVLDEIAAMTGEERPSVGQIEKALGQTERVVMAEVETKSMRATIAEALKQLIVVGNCLIQMLPNGGMRLFRLDRYVVSRDGAGNILEIVLYEDIAPAALDDATRMEVQGDQQGQQNALSADKNLKLYTHIKRVVKGPRSFWEAYQEINGKRIKGTEAQYPIDKLPYIAARWTKLDGDDYGRGYVEEYLGDLRSLESLRQTLTEGSAMASKVVFFVNPNGTTKITALKDAPNGAIRAGKAEDVTVLTMDKQRDYSTVQNTINNIEENLSRAFLMNASVQRDAERVTAEEIRYMAQELEQTLGGVYSILATEFQLPLVTTLLHQLEQAKKIPALPPETVRPSIVTGMEALGRGNDLNKLTTFLQTISAVGPEQIAPYLNISDYIKRVGASLGIDPAGLIRSDEEVQAANAEAAEQANAQQTLQTVAPIAGNVIRDQLNPKNGGIALDGEAVQEGLAEAAQDIEV